MSARALLLAVTLFLVAAPVAMADGDPASDYLLSQPSFVPPDAGVPPAYATQLNEVLKDAKARGYEIRVALIATRYDLGSVGLLYRQPERYARFLGQELAFVYHGRLLVTMPNGFGYSRGGKRVPAGQAVVARLPPPGKDGAALASGATQAVVKLAAKSGVTVAVPPLTGDASKPNPNRDRLLIAGVSVLAVAGVVVLRLLRRWR